MVATVILDVKNGRSWTGVYQHKGRQVLPVKSIHRINGIMRAGALWHQVIPIRLPVIRSRFALHFGGVLLAVFACTDSRLEFSKLFSDGIHRVITAADSLRYLIAR
jgi:hypothetical protein